MIGGGGGAKGQQFIFEMISPVVVLDVVQRFPNRIKRKYIHTANLIIWGFSDGYNWSWWSWSQRWRDTTFTGIIGLALNGGKGAVHGASSRDGGSSGGSVDGGSVGTAVSGQGNVGGTSNESARGNAGGGYLVLVYFVCFALIAVPVPLLDVG